MKINIELSPEEANRFPQLIGLDRSLDDLVNEAATIQRNKEALYRFQKEVFNGHDWSIETLSRHLTADFVDHAAMPGDLPGFEGVQQRFSIWAQTFSDAMEENQAVLGQGDMVAVLYDLHAHHSGEFLGIEATHRDVVIPGIEFLQFRDGKIAAHWGIYDFLNTAEQIGADLAFLPRPAPAEPRYPTVPWGQGANTADEEEMVHGD
ncbi:MAG TPA: ester cyclase [Longimicrobium sp.]|jgi:predicted ester cyclase